MKEKKKKKRKQRLGWEERKENMVGQSCVPIEKYNSQSQIRDIYSGEVQFTATSHLRLQERKVDRIKFGVYSRPHSLNHARKMQRGKHNGQNMEIAQCPRRKKLSRFNNWVTV